jgi:TRAP-type mannitol/chloroaromatic compound transport system permease small subunit
MERFVRIVDAFTEALGRGVSWLVLVMTIVTCVVVVLRYGFSVGSIALQESVLYLHGLVFMLGIPYALKHDAHVRVDVLYGRMSDRTRDWVDLAGHLLFLLPLAGFVLYVSWDYTARSWRILEGSQEVGGLPAVFLLKTLIPLLAVTLALQGVAEILRIVLRRTGRS